VPPLRGQRHRKETNAGIEVCYPPVWDLREHVINEFRKEMSVSLEK
jgi:hypothetical protein